MTIELIDMDTGVILEAPADKTSGLQFSGKPTERAWKADELQQKVILHLEGEYVLDDDDWGLILEALELMAQERTND